MLKIALWEESLFYYKGQNMHNNILGEITAGNNTRYAYSQPKEHSLSCALQVFTCCEQLSYLYFRLQQKEIFPPCSECYFGVKENYFT